MLKKLFKSISVFLLTAVLSVTLLPSVAFAAGTEKKQPGIIQNVIGDGGGGGNTYVNRAEMIHEIGAPGYGQTDQYYYVQPAEARRLADYIAIGDGDGFALYLVSLIPMAYVPGVLLATFSYVGQTYRNSVAANIRTLSESGPVQIKISRSSYGTYYSASSWDSTTGSMNWGTYDYYDHGYHYTNIITSFLYN